MLQVKRIQRDMWCEIPAGAILETVYYRYIYFHEDGRVFYSLTISSPHETIRRFLQVLRHGEMDPTIACGTFQVHGKVVTVTAKQDWQHVKLELGILPHSNWGRFGALTFDRHLTSPSGNFDEYAWPNDIHVYEVPSELFRYVYDRRFL
jgi:F-box protein 9